MQEFTDLFDQLEDLERPLSAMAGRDSALLNVMLPFYVRPEGHILDVTCNERRMWDGVRWGGEVTYSDIDPAMKPDIVCSWDDVPFPDESLDAIVFDPPHLPLAAASERSMKHFVRQYGLKEAPNDDSGPVPLFHGFLVEARRLLRPDGVVLAKLKDYVHNHRYQWTLARWVEAVEGVDGMTPCDLVVKFDPAAANLKSGRWKNSYHVRNAHCWWAIVRKGRCEPRR